MSCIPVFLHFDLPEIKIMTVFLSFCLSVFNPTVAAAPTVHPPQITSAAAAAAAVAGAGAGVGAGGMPQAGSHARKLPSGKLPSGPDCSVLLTHVGQLLL